MRNVPIVLTEKQEKWLKNHYKHTKNAEIAAKFGISTQSVVNLAKRRGLSKSRQFMTKCQRATTEAARKANLLRVYPPGFTIPNSEAAQFKPGVSNLEKLGKRTEERRKAAVVKSRNATIRKEKARIAFGLPQKTNLRIGRQPREKILLRYYLKKRGYLVDDGERVAYYDEHTKRGKRVEARQQRWYTFAPVNAR